MPSWVKNDDIWERAKKTALESHKETDDGFYAIVTSIYKKMGGVVAKSQPRLILLKSYVKAHDRKLKNGQTIHIEAHYDKRSKKGVEHAPGHNYDLSHLSDADKEKFNRMHAEHHHAHYYEAHALSNRLAEEQDKVKQHLAEADEHEKAGRKVEATRARNKATKANANAIRHQKDLAKIHESVAGLAKLKEKMVSGSGTLHDNADQAHAHYVSKLGKKFADKKMILIKKDKASNISPVSTGENADKQRGNDMQSAQASVEPPKKTKKTKTVEAVAVPENAFKTKASFVVQKVGNKWLEVTHPGKTFKMQLAIAPETAHYKAGDTIEDLPVGKVESYSKYGNKVTYYPLPKEEPKPFVPVNVPTKTQALKGHTFEIKEHLKSKFGAIWNGSEWRVPVDKHEEAQKFVNDNQPKNKEPRLILPVKSNKVKVLYPTSGFNDAPNEITRGGVKYKLTGVGNSFKINADHPSTEGSHLLGHEGENGAYHYYEPVGSTEDSAPATKPAAAMEQAPVPVPSSSKFPSSESTKTYLFASGFEAPKEVEIGGERYKLHTTQKFAGNITDDLMKKYPQLNGYREQEFSRYVYKKMVSDVTFLNIPFSKKDKAKKLGAKWNAASSKWYIPDGVDIPDALKEYVI
jgi:Domain of unknown function (DUF5710)